MRHTFVFLNFTVALKNVGASDQQSSRLLLLLPTVELVEASGPDP